jgi:hypothetical protein
MRVAVSQKKRKKIHHEGTKNTKQGKTRLSNNAADPKKTRRSHPVSFSVFSVFQSFFYQPPRRKEIKRPNHGEHGEQGEEQAANLLFFVLFVAQSFLLSFVAFMPSL